eukprot:scaffold102398_cov19-Tisochrysis_lutea.AAC.3
MEGEFLLTCCKHPKILDDFPAKAATYGICANTWGSGQWTFHCNRDANCILGCGCVRLQASAPRMGALEYSSCSIALACVASKDLTLRRGRAEAAEAANISAVEGENAMQVDAGRWGP